MQQFISSIGSRWTYGVIFPFITFVFIVCIFALETVFDWNAEQKDIDTFILMNSIKITTKSTDGTLFGLNQNNYFQINHDYYVTTPKLNPTCPNINPIDSSSWCQNTFIYFDYRGNIHTGLSELPSKKK